MHNLEKIIGFRFKDIRNLANAMCSIQVFRPGAGENSREYYNSTLATVGDSVIKSILADALFRKGLYMGEITQIKSSLESNDYFYKLSNDYGLYRYSFNRKYFYDDAPGHEKLPNSKHNAFFEATVGAVFYDSGYEKCREWLLSKFYSQLM